MPENHSLSCIVLVATRGFALSNSRRLLIREMQKAGYKVIIATADDSCSRDLAREGVTLVPVCFDRGGVAFFNDLVALFRLWKIYRQYQPVLIHHFNAKPLIIGSLAARWAMPRKKCAVINTITGLGHAFIKGGFVKLIASFGYKVISSSVAVTIFQNRDDRALFLEQSWVNADRTRLVTGSGVDTEKYIPAYQLDSSGRMNILMVSRLLNQKGVPEYIQMAEILKRRYKNVIFKLGGEIDQRHPDSVSGELIEDAVDRGIIEYIGYVDAFEKQLASTSVFVFPSYYREGVPRVVMEAASSGVPVVAADVPGTREAVRDGDTGFLVRAKDSAALADRVGLLIENSDLCRKMGVASRKLAESSFDIRSITKQQLAIYAEFGINVSNA